MAPIMIEIEQQIFPQKIFSQMGKEQKVFPDGVTVVVGTKWGDVHAFSETSLGSDGVTISGHLKSWFPGEEVPMDQQICVYTTEYATRFGDPKIPGRSRNYIHWDPRTGEQVKGKIGVSYVREE